MSTKKRWIRVTHARDLPVRQGRVAHIAGRELAIFNLGDRFVAIENRCPHRGGPLADGIVAENEVVCPLHAWKVDLRSGEAASPFAAGENSLEPLCVETFPVRLEQGIVLLEIPLTPNVQRRARCEPDEIERAGAGQVVAARD